MRKVIGKEYWLPMNDYVNVFPCPKRPSKNDMLFVIEQTLRKQRLTSGLTAEKIRKFNEDYILHLLMACAPDNPILKTGKSDDSS